jgi:quercetin dioxygenase-like cupin family protein
MKIGGRFLCMVLFVFAPALLVPACASNRAGGQAPRAFYRTSGAGVAYWGPGDLYTFLATGEETNGAYFQLEAVVPPGAGPPPHIHHNEAESFYLVEGSLEMLLGDETVTAHAGDFVNVPRDTIHGFKNVGTETAKMVATFVPAGFESYFEEVFTRATDRDATPPPVTPELIQRMTEAAPRHGLEILPPAAPSR